MSAKRKDTGQRSVADIYRAVAMSYDEKKEEAPRVRAKGAGDLADRIVELAEQHDIPLYEDPDLTELLFQLDLDQQIPVSLYEAVAEVFAFLYRLNREAKESNKN